VWLPQGTAWPKLHKNYGWPDSVTADVDRVVNNGHEVVGVAHRQCRQQVFGLVSVETVILASRNCTDKQHDANTADRLPHVRIFREDGTIIRHRPLTNLTNAH